MARPTRTSIRLPAIQRTDSLPYMAIRDYIADRIASGQFSAGTRLPSERQLQEALGRNRGTLRDALLQLEGEGLIYRQSRSGWYVAGGRVRYDPLRPEGFTTYVAEQNKSPATSTLSADSVRSTAELARWLDVETGADAYALLRLRSIDDRPVLVEHLYVSAERFPGLLEHSLDGSLTGLLQEQYGTRVVRMQIDMSPCMLPVAEAALLRVVPGTPGLHLTRRSFDADGHVVEYNIEYWRHDVIDVHFEVTFNQSAKVATSVRGSAAPRPASTARRRSK